jgi:hypothetical protein
MNLTKEEADIAYIVVALVAGYFCLWRPRK